MKGIVLAGGEGTRLYPLTKSISKQLLPVYDKPMVYYPISVLMLAGIREILLISTPRDIDLYKSLLGDGSQWGVKISYEIQKQPKGIAHAFKIGAQFIGNESVCLVLGDNIFFGQGFISLLRESANLISGAKVFGYPVKDPERYGVIEFDQEMNVIGIEEKPHCPLSNYVLTGLYFYDNQVVEFANKIKHSLRGELEITDINKCYLEQNELKVQLLGRGFAWLDTGTPESLQEASQYVQTIEHRQGLKIACLEEIAYMNQWITSEELIALGKSFGSNAYGEYLLELVK